MKALIKFLHFMEDSCLVSLILGLVILSVAQIIMRNMGIAGFMWADSASRIAVLWLAIFGAMRASRIRNHIAMDLISHYASATLQQVLHIIVSLSCAGICAIAAYYCWDFVLDEYTSDTMAFLNVPVWFTEAIIPFGLTIIALRFFIQTFVFIPVGDKHSTTN